MGKRWGGEVKRKRGGGERNDEEKGNRRRRKEGGGGGEEKRKRSEKEDEGEVETNIRKKFGEEVENELALYLIPKNIQPLE